MKIKIKKKNFNKITNDDEYIESWEESNRLDGQASLVCDIVNGDVEPSHKLSASLDRKRNKILDSLRKFRAAQGWDDEKQN